MHACVCVCGVYCGMCGVCVRVLVCMWCECVCWCEYVDMWMCGMRCVYIYVCVCGVSVCVSVHL